MCPLQRFLTPLTLTLCALAVLLDKMPGVLVQPDSHECASMSHVILVAHLRVLHDAQ